MEKMKEILKINSSKPNSNMQSFMGDVSRNISPMSTLNITNSMANTNIKTQELRII
jgi:hypothetical protein